MNKLKTLLSLLVSPAIIAPPAVSIVTSITTSSNHISWTEEDYEKQINLISQKLDQIAAEIEGIDAQSKMILNNIDTLQKQLDQEQQTYNELLGQIADDSNLHARLQVARDNIQKFLNNIKDENRKANKLQQKKEQLQKALEQLQGQQKDLQAELDDLTGQKTSLLNQWQQQFRTATVIDNKTLKIFLAHPRHFSDGTTDGHDDEDGNHPGTGTDDDSKNADQAAKNELQEIKSHSYVDITNQKDSDGNMKSFKFSKVVQTSDRAINLTLDDGVFWEGNDAGNTKIDFIIHLGIDDTIKTNIAVNNWSPTANIKSVAVADNRQQIFITLDDNAKYLKDPNGEKWKFIQNTNFALSGTSNGGIFVPDGEKLVQKVSWLNDLTNKGLTVDGNALEKPENVLVLSLINPFTDVDNKTVRLTFTPPEGTQEDSDQWPIHFDGESSPNEVLNTQNFEVKGLSGNGTPKFEVPDGQQDNTFRLKMNNVGWLDMSLQKNNMYLRDAFGIVIGYEDTVPKDFGNSGILNVQKGIPASDIQQSGNSVSMKWNLAQLPNSNSYSWVRWIHVQTKYKDKDGNSSLLLDFDDKIGSDADHKSGFFALNSGNWTNISKIFDKTQKDGLTSSPKWITSTQQKGSADHDWQVRGEGKGGQNYELKSELENVQGSKTWSFDIYVRYEYGDGDSAYSRSGSSVDKNKALNDFNYQSVSEWTSTGGVGVEKIHVSSQRDNSNQINLSVSTIHANNITNRGGHYRNPWLIPTNDKTINFSNGRGANGENGSPWVTYNSQIALFFGFEINGNFENPTLRMTYGAHTEYHYWFGNTDESNNKWRVFGGITAWIDNLQADGYKLSDVVSHNNSF